jgi:hypothetical protein
MTLRNEIIEELNGLYEKEGIVPSNFKCTNSEKCKVDAGREICGRGAQAHVGSKYGEDIRIIVLSLDTGGGGADNIQERTETIEGLKFSDANSHMKGTIEFLRAIFPGKSDSECLKFFSMTNSAKCSGVTQNKLPAKVYENCSKVHKEEIEILRPQLIISQGNDAYPSFLKPRPLLDEEYNLFWKYFNIENQDVKIGIRHTINKYIKKVNLSEDNIVPLIHGPHPSARDGRWQVFKEITLPLLSLYVKFLTKYNKPF